MTDYRREGEGAAYRAPPAATAVADALPFGTIARYRLSLVRETSVPFDTSTRYDQPERAARFLHELHATADREMVGALLLASTYHAIGHTIAYIGTINQAPVEPRGILLPALLANAAAIIAAHNHPSGDPTPSTDDINLTNKLVAAAKLLGIAVLDHIIIGEPPTYNSLWTTHPW